MIMLVWWILSLFGVCEFTWLAVVIDLSVSTVLSMPSIDEGPVPTPLLTMSGAIFAVCKHFLSLSISGWWILAAPVWFVLAAFIPGGFTITNLLLSHFGLMALPTWAFVVGIVGDVGMLIALIAAIVVGIRSKAL